ncbi:hypothetical protein AUK40_00165 [Candidatus Wirthbacteria bacterium CG2_30_54_11]|uniref:Uncharacterized protein n=1 Tax=Candidatus Wirthbacteria bacterium CG2_30_54_11 TaxID=1817892 RepID=A0A1J5IUP3_9BACT|nr:MAG: hypothetical protein AUK40_00165 [Candidatus Wirthbacteria bacterium CG2_30_54_11]
MEWINRSYGQLLVYLFQTSFAGVMSLFGAGFFLGWFAVGYIRGVEVVAAGKIEKRRGGWLKLILGIGLLSAAVGAQGASFVGDYWPVLLFGLLTGIVFPLAHLVTVSALGLLILGCAFLLVILSWTLHAFTGKTAILQVRVRSIENTTEQQRISLIVTDLRTKDEAIYYVNGDKWGVSANVVLFEDWVVFLGGKTYYRLNSIVGATDTTLDRRVIDTASEPLWQELEQNEEHFPGIRAVYENIILKEPSVGSEYTIFVDHDGSLVPEPAVSAP